MARNMYTIHSVTQYLYKMCSVNDNIPDDKPKLTKLPPDTGQNNNVQPPPA